ncbi:MAG: histidine kinase internal region [Gemmatimonadetes bacterium]|nr:histidine kinase internal region [Gemmatimonadota bacterium]
MSIALTWLVIASIFVTQNIVSNRPLNGTMPWMRVLAWELEYWLVFALFSSLFWRMTTRYGFERGRRMRGALAHLAVGAAFALAQPALATMLNYATVIAVGGMEDPRLGRILSSAPHAYPVLVISAFWKYLVVIGACSGLVYQRRNRENEVHHAVMREQLAVAELRSLQMQLQPHFLFKALHSAAMLTLIDPARSHEVLVQLAALLRRTLEPGMPLAATLVDELDFLDRYLDIERVRFEDRLLVRFEVPGHLEAAMVPSLLLQPLVENAITHGFAATTVVHVITIRARSRDGTLVLEVEDDGSGLREGWSERSVRVGLANVQARLDLANGRSTPLEFVQPPGGGLLVRLSLPLIPGASALHAA